jgi:hypothetical protein
MPWHRDPFHRSPWSSAERRLRSSTATAGEGRRFAVAPGQADWDEPSDRVHRGVNVGEEPYEEVPIFFMDRADAEPQPRAETL